MKSCQIWGDMSSDKVDEQYPVVAVCDECSDKFSKADDRDPEIVNCSAYDPSSGDDCHFCGITIEEESAS